MILWVDDDLSLALQSYIDELSDAGYKVLKAASPDEMLTFLKENTGKIFGIIMDILMPTGLTVGSKESRGGDITGLVLLKRLKEAQETSEIPIVIFTIVSDQDVVDWAERNRVPLKRKQETTTAELLQVVEQMGIRKDA